jgi:hypothetical protein
MATFSPTNALVRVDLPTFGRPQMVIIAVFVIFSLPFLCVLWCFYYSIQRPEHQDEMYLTRDSREGYAGEKFGERIATRVLTSFGSTRFPVLALRRRKARSLRCSSFPMKTHFIGLFIGEPKGERGSQ